MPDVHPRLLVTTPPKSNETLTGYLMRLSALNLYETPAWILTTSVLDKGDNNWRWAAFVFCPTTKMKRLSELLALDLPALEALRYPPAEAEGRGVGEHLFFGAPIPRSVIRPDQPKVCSECLKESQHCQRIWDLKLVTCCPIHRCLLIDQCPDCGKRLKWYRPEASTCHCSFDLREVPLTPMNDAASRLCGTLCQVCGLPGTSEGAGVRGDNPLATLNLEHLVTAVLFISSRMITHGGMKGRGLTFLSNSETHDLMLRVASIFEVWPDRFHDFLEYERSRPRYKNSAAMNREFGLFYESLFVHARLSHTSLHFLRLGFASYLERREEGHHIRRVKLNLKYITRHVAEKRLGVEWKALRRFISEGKLKTVTRRGWNRDRILVEAESLENLKEELGQLLDSVGTAKYLGVTRNIVLELAATGCLKAVSGPNIDGNKGLKFYRKDVENLMRSITGCPLEDDPLSEHCPDLRTAIKRFGRPTWGVIRTVKAILAGDLLPESGPPEAKLHSLN